MATFNAGYATNPRPFRPFGRNTVVEARRSLALPKVRTFTMSHPLRWALGYYAVC